ncbi:MAG: baseplate J/gp47 family protein [Oscillospiraceae bacterium]|nr:baseplate J/gp47 family protein [Oscillospiraceae bacterium]
MLGNINLADKSYEELIGEAVEKIPLYTDEWTNFNPSDPGITILQNLSAFTMIQQNRINEVTDEIRLRLLEMLGFKPGEYKSAKVLLQQAKNMPVSLKAGEKLLVGSLCFETDSPIELSSWGIKAVYCYNGGVKSGFRDVTYLLDKNTGTNVPVFGNPVVNGSSLYFIFDRFPFWGNKKEFVMSVDVKNDIRRNCFDDSDFSLAEVGWQCYTDRGWIDLESEDETRGFLLSGNIRLKLPSHAWDTAQCNFTDLPRSGFAVRCVLASNCYDIPPGISRVSVNLFGVSQRDTKSKSFVFSDPQKVELKHRMADYGYFTVYAREKKKGAYRAYTPYTPYSKSENGRYYLISRIPQEEGGGFRFDFDEERFGFAPKRCNSAVRIICYNDETIHHYKIGRVAGYENQIIDLEQLENVLPDEFRLLVENLDEDGEKAYYFMKPGQNEPGNLCYSVLSGEGKIKIVEPGLADDCRLYLSDCVVTAGEGGNVIAGNKFVKPDGGDLFVFNNPSPGSGGSSAESNEELRMRFLREIKTPFTAVTAEDYETLTLKTPGYCIHKVKAVYERGRNVVSVAVKPFTSETFPTMSPIQYKRIFDWLNARRMITTKLEIRQPVYVPIDVQTKVLVKNYSGDAKGEIENFIMQELDGVTTDVPFGACLSYYELFKGLESLSCSESVYELNIFARERRSAKVEGSDIRLADDALYYAGKINVEIVRV